MLSRPSIINLFKYELNGIGIGQFIILKSTTASIDALDAFTKDLVDKNMSKWYAAHEKFKDQSSTESLIMEMQQKFYNNSKLEPNFTTIDKTLTHINLNVNNMKNLSQSELDDFFIGIFQEDNNLHNLDQILNECLKCKISPSYNILQNCFLQLCLNDADSTEHVRNLHKFCESISKECNEWISRRIMIFNGLKLWNDGKIDNALDMLISHYEIIEKEKNVNSNFKRPQIYVADHSKCIKLLHWTFNKIILDTIGKKSEAVLMVLERTANTIYAQYNDIYVLSVTWRNCFLSDWYSDRKLALKIFENTKNLRHLVYKRSSWLCFKFLRENNVDAVYRLIELYLKFNEKNACKACLDQLFIYQYWRKDTRSCFEIIKTYQELNMPLSKDQIEKIFDLIINRSKGKPILSNLLHTTKQYQYKF